MMHGYSTDSPERQRVPVILAGLAVGCAWLLAKGLDVWQITWPWWADAPSTMGFYGLLHGAFDRWVWRLGVWLKVLSVPVLAGDWSGYVTSSFDEHAAQHQVTAKIKQTWSRLSVTFQTQHSRSESVVATLRTDAPDPCLTYEYHNEPLPGAVDGMQAHRGTARLYLTNSTTLEGDYYSGRGRENQGRVRLTHLNA
jgi:hypothetical protein